MICRQRIIKEDPEIWKSVGTLVTLRTRGGTQRVTRNSRIRRRSVGRRSKLRDVVAYVRRTQGKQANGNCIDGCPSVSTYRCDKPAGRFQEERHGYFDDCRSRCARAILIDAALKCPHVAELISFQPSIVGLRVNWFVGPWINR